MTSLSLPIDHNDPHVQASFSGSDHVATILDDFSHPGESGKINAKNLRRLGDRLVPTEKRIKAARKVIDKVVEAIQLDCPRVNADRFCVSGSLGKMTALEDFDIDLIVFVNDEEPPFRKTLDSLTKDLPRSIECLEMEITTRFSVQFCLDDFDVDLLPAANFSQKVDLQNSKVLERCAKTKPEDLRYWGSSLAEATVAWMKEKSPFVNAALRLAKLWKKSCTVLPGTFPRWFSSFLIEILVSDLAEKELHKNPSNASLLRVLESFWQALAHPEKICVANNCRMAPSNILKERPLILDPVNPFTNIAKSISGWHTIKVLAASSLSRLQNQTNDARVADLFRFQISNEIPQSFAFHRFSLRGLVQDSFWRRSLTVKRISDLQGRKTNPGVTWRHRHDLDPSHCPLNVQDILERRFFAFVELGSTLLLNVVTEKRFKGVGEVKAASDFVDQALLEVFGTHISDWHPSSGTHEERDITLTFWQIPIASYPDDLRYISLELSTNLDRERVYRFAYDYQRACDQELEDEAY